MRYRLRTLFVVLTLLCCLLGYLGCQLNWVRERQRFVADHKTIFFEHASRSRPARFRSTVLSLLAQSQVATIYVTIPTIRIQPDGSETQVADPLGTVPRLKRLFPEADVIAFPYRVRGSPGETHNPSAAAAAFASSPLNIAVDVPQPTD